MAYKFRIKTIHVGMMTYYQPQIQKKFLFWTYWESFTAYTRSGEINYGSTVKHDSKERAEEDIENHKLLKP